ncbi:MAG: putative NADH-quinone oxidoreductase subunit M [Candidatus Thorarchaeota archaeon]|nr:MAG: putative NADH-quinone oxidoreductase subunit M [Candidatus Thorarchaeota archaeon]
MQLFTLPILSEYPMILTLLGLIAGGLLTLLVGQKSEKGGQAMAALSLLGGLFLNILLVLQIWNGATVFHDIVWLGNPSNPIMTLGFLGDGLSAAVAILILGLGLFSVLFSFVYMKKVENPGLYYSLMVWFVAAMVGVVYATNLMQFFIFYELMLIPAFILVYLYGVSEDAQERSRNALQFWVWTALGGLISLLATFILFGATGTMDIAVLYTSPLAVSTAQTIGIIFLLGFGIKLGLVPLHVWAPPVYREAPMPVLVLLSGAMTKTAAYGVIRIVIPIVWTAMETFTTGLMTIAIITMFYGAMLAIAQKDLKMMLAYSSISQLGYLMFGYSTMTLMGLSGAAFQLINHGILASLTFFCAGALKMKTGTLEFDKLGGLAPKMPILASIYILGALALAGTPPLSAFAGEWMIFAGAAQLATSANASVILVILTVLGVVATGLTAGYYLWSIRRIFLGPIRDGFEQVTDPPKIILGIIAILAIIVVVLGVWPWLLWRFMNPVLSGLLGGG